MACMCTVGVVLGTKSSLVIIAFFSASLLHLAGGEKQNRAAAVVHAGGCVLHDDRNPKTWNEKCRSMCAVGRWDERPEARKLP